MKKEVPKIVFNAVQVADLLSVQGQGGRQSCALCPHIPGAPGGSSTARRRMPRKAFDVSRKFGTWFFLLSRKAEDLGQEEGGFVLGQDGVTSFTLPERNSVCQEDSRQSQEAEAPLHPEFLMPMRGPCHLKSELLAAAAATSSFHLKEPLNF